MKLFGLKPAVELTTEEIDKLRAIEKEEYIKEMRKLMADRGRKKARVDLK